MPSRSQTMLRDPLLPVRASLHSTPPNGDEWDLPATLLKEQYVYTR